MYVGFRQFVEQFYTNDIKINLSVKKTDLAAQLYVSVIKSSFIYHMLIIWKRTLYKYSDLREIYCTSAELRV